MLHTVILIIIAILIMANIVILADVSRNPMFKAMDKYNRHTDDEYVSTDDIAEVLRNLRGDIDDVKINITSMNIDGRLARYGKRLTELEDKFIYHIQSTDELKPKA